MARVNDRSHHFIRHPHVYPQMEWANYCQAAARHRTLVSNPSHRGYKAELDRVVGYIPKWYAPSPRRRSPIQYQPLCGGLASNSRPLSRKSDALTIKLPSHLQRGASFSCTAFSTPLRIKIVGGKWDRDVARLQTSTCEACCRVCPSTADQFVK